jgi:hypothetical protein
MSVLTFIGSGLYIAISVIAVIAMASSAGPLRGGGVEVIAALLYLAIGLLFLVPAGFLWRYASNIHTFRFSSRMPDLESALEAQKSYWKFMGTLMLVLLVFCALLVVPAMFFATATTLGS